MNTITDTSMEGWNEIVLDKVFRKILWAHKGNTTMNMKVLVENITTLGDFRPISPQVIKAYCAFLKISHMGESDFNTLPSDMGWDVTLYQFGSTAEYGVAEGSHRVLTARILKLKYIVCRVIKNKKRSDTGLSLNKFERHVITKASNNMKTRTQSSQDVTAVMCQIMTAFIKHLHEKRTETEWKQTLDSLMP